MSDQQDKWEDCGSCLKCGNVVVGKGKPRCTTPTPDERKGDFDIKKEVSEKEVKEINEKFKKALDEMDEEDNSEENNNKEVADESSDDDQVDFDEKYESVPIGEICREHTYTRFTDCFKCYPLDDVFGKKSKKRLCAEVIAKSNSNVLFTIDSIRRFCLNAAAGLDDAFVYIENLLNCLIRQASFLFKTENGSKSDLFVATMIRIRFFSMMMQRVLVLHKEIDILCDFLEKKMVDETKHGVIDEYSRKHL